MGDVITRFKLETTQFDSKLRDEAKRLSDLTNQLSLAGKDFNKFAQQHVETARSFGQVASGATNLKDKLRDLVGAYNQVAKAYNAMSKEQQQTDYGKALAESLQKLQGDIRQTKEEMNAMPGVLDKLTDRFTVNIDAIKLFNVGLQAAEGALKVAKDAFFQSESGIDEWGRTVEGAKGAYSVFLDTLNNGNWSNFFQNLSAAIRGGRDLYDVFDRLGSIKSNNAAAIAITQKEIAELRLAKQQGENVDAKLKAATERLAALQKQSVSAGMAAGSQSAFQTIRNGVNSVGGAGVNDATIKYAVDRIMKGGQGEFDKYKRNYEILQQKGTRTTVTPIDDGMGGTVNKYQSSFDINLLTKEQQKQYALAKAITEGETRIQQGIAAYAQAVSEGTASAREEFKGNRYALQGAGGSGGGSGGSDDKGFDIASIAFSAMSDSSMKYDPNQYFQSVHEKFGPENILGSSDVWVEYSDKVSESLEKIGTSASNLTEWTADFDPFKESMDNLTKTAKQNQMVMSLAGQAVNSFSAALAGMEDPGVKAAGIVMQSLASIALGFAQAAASPLVTGTGWGWLAFLAAGLGAMATAISTVHSLTGYAQGGIVEGNSYSGDNMMFGGDGLYGLNAGELVLTKSQQNSLAQQLSGNGMGSINVSGRISGTDILLSADRAAQASGRGQLVTWK